MWNPWKTHWVLALVKGIREPHEVQKNSFDLGGNRTHDLRIRSTVTLLTELLGRTEKVRDAPCVLKSNSWQKQNRCWTLANLKLRTEVFCKQILSLIEIRKIYQKCSDISPPFPWYCQSNGPIILIWVSVKISTNPSPRVRSWPWHFHESEIQVQRN